MEAGGCVDENGTPCGKLTNCSACDGLCYDHDWSGDGRKCEGFEDSPLGPCDDGCNCVPPPASYDASTHASPACCGYGAPFGSCDGQLMPTLDHDRGKDYNHATFLDLVIEGLVGVRAEWGDALVVQPSADAAEITHFALDSLLYHGRNLSVIYDPEGAVWPAAGCVGLCVFVDGAIAARADALARLTVQL